MPCCTKKPSVIDDENNKQIRNQNTPYIFQSTVSSSKECQELIQTPAKLQTNKFPTLVIDLDETLIHSEFEFTNNCETIIKLPITKQTCELQQDFNLDYIPCYLAVRNNIKESIQKLAEYYYLILWTASYPDYADNIIDYLGVRKYFDAILYRNDCTIMHDGIRKDLRKLQRDLSQVLIIDNDKTNFSLQPENGIQISDFTGKLNDLVFQDLASYLIKLQNKQIDFRSHEIKRVWP